MRTQRILRLVPIGVIAILIAGCTPTASPGGVITLPRDYGNCSGPSGEYIYRANPQESLDVFPHIGGGSVGTIVFIHGGGFNAGDKRGDGSTCSSPGLSSMHMGAIMKQRENGWDIISVNYRLITGDAGTKYPGPLIDVSEAVKWLKGLGGQIVGLNQGNVVVVGHSAGGTLAALLGAYSGQNVLGTQFPTIQGWVAISAPLDPGAGQGAANFNTLVDGNIFGFTITNASPAANLGAGDPDGYLIHGVNDPLVSINHSRSIRNLAAQRGNSVTLDEVTPDRNKAGESNDSDHFAIGGANYTALTGWLATH